METGRTKKETGKQAERYAERYLKRQGLKLVERNFHCRGGEIDLIMQDGKGLVFVEVRFRKTQHYGGALASVDWHKQQRLLRAAQYYLQRLAPKEPPCRFDVVAVAPGSGNELSVDWIKNAIEMV